MSWFSTRMRSFWKEASGAALLEFAAVFMMVLTVTFAVIDFGFALWQFNMGTKAAFQGARLAVQSDPVASRLTTFSGVEDLGLAAGQDITLAELDAFTIRCTTGGCSCSGGGCGAFGDPGFDAAALQPILDTVIVGAPFSATQDDIYVEYSHVGQGFAGRPGNDIVPLVTVGIDNTTYRYLFLSALGIGDLDFGDIKATLPGEDLNSGAPD